MKCNVIQRKRRMSRPAHSTGRIDVWAVLPRAHRRVTSVVTNTSLKYLNTSLYQGLLRRGNGGKLPPPRAWGEFGLAGRIYKLIS